MSGIQYTENEDQDLVKRIKTGLEKRNNHCPCRVEMTEDTLCPCKEMREEGKCHCGLYI